MVTQLNEVHVGKALGEQGYNARGTTDEGQVVGDYTSPIYSVGLEDIADLLWYHVDPKPSEQNLVDWENARLTELADIESDKQIIVDEVESFGLVRGDYVLAFELMNKLVNAFANGQTPSTDTVYANFVSGLNGTNLEDSITNYVTMMTALTEFGLAIPSNEKRQIMDSAISYLQSLVLVGIIKGLV